MKVQLVYPPLDYPSKYYLASPPLSLLSIATFTKEKCPEVEVEILDAALVPLQELKNSLGADVVGISCCSYNYKSALEIAELAKENGSFVVFGGPHASFFCKKILEKRKYIDAVIFGSGEVPFLKILKNIQTKNKLENCNIDGIYFRNNGVIVGQDGIFEDINKMPMIDYSFVDLKEYWKRTDKNIAPKFASISTNFKLYAPYISHFGCGYRRIGKKCIFCSIPSFKLSCKEPHMVWKEISSIRNNLGVDIIRDFGDDIICDKKWLRMLHDIKPSNLDVSFIGYARVGGIDSETANMLKNMNFKILHIGFESGDNEMLKQLKKGCTTENIKESLKILEDFDINVIPSFILGGIKETENTINHTIELFEYVKEKKNVFDPQLLLLVPFPGSKAYEMLMQMPDIRKKFNDLDAPDLRELQKDWFSHFCHVTLSYVEKIREKLDARVRML